MKCLCRPHIGESLPTLIQQQIQLMVAAVPAFLVPTVQRYTLEEPVQAAAAER